MADIILYTCAHWPPDDPSWRPGSESLEDFLNGQARDGKTLAFVMPSIDGRHVTLIFTSRWCTRKRGSMMRKLVVLGGAAVIIAAAACSSSPAKTTGTEVFQGKQTLTAAESASNSFTPTYPLAFTGPVTATATWSPPGGNATKVTTTFKTTAGNLVVNADVPNANNPPTTVNATTCLMTSTITGTYTVVGSQSTSKFKGAAGSGKIVDVFQATGPKLSDGKCNTSQNAQPLPSPAPFTTFYASGPLTVSS